MFSNSSIYTIYFRRLDGFQEAAHHLKSEFLEFLKYYDFRVKFLLGLVKKSVEVCYLFINCYCLSNFSQKEFGANLNQPISLAVYEHMNRDISVVVARLILVLRDEESYKQLLAYRGKDAQRLLDLLQDVSFVFSRIRASADRASTSFWILTPFRSLGH